LPTVVFVRAKTYRGPTPYVDADGTPLVPIGPTTHTWTGKGGQCSRTQFPISVAYAITVHKSQGLSLELVVVGLGCRKDFSRGLSFVAISRARSLMGLAFVGPVTRERLTRTIDSKSRAREAAHIADAARRATLALPAPSDHACDHVEELFFL
jgi:ATP-dependent DNA helicase PIF1